MANRIQIQELLQTEDEKLIKEMKSLFVCEQIKKIAKNSFEISFLIKKTFVKDLLTFVAIWKVAPINSYDKKSKTVMPIIIIIYLLLWPQFNEK